MNLAKNVQHEFTKKIGLFVERLTNFKQRWDQKNILINDCNREGYSIDQYHDGYSHNIPLTVIENIFDFWIDIYPDHDVWQKCLGLLRIRKRLNSSKNILLNNLKGSSYKYASNLERLLCYRPASFLKEITNNKKLMW